jgi:hypothetical protein
VFPEFSIGGVNGYKKFLVKNRSRSSLEKNFSSKESFGCKHWFSGMEAYPGNLPGQLATFGKRPFLNPNNQTPCPFPDSIAWHQQTLFRNR